MKKIRLKSLRAILFFLLALLFAVLAALEAIPKPQTEGFVQTVPFSVKSSPNAGGGYTYQVEGSIKSYNRKTVSLNFVEVHVLDKSSETRTIELKVGKILPEEVRKLSGELTANVPASKIVGVSTSIKDGDQPIPVLNEGFQMTTGFVAFAALAFVSLVLSIVFFARRMRHHRRKVKS